MDLRQFCCTGGILFLALTICDSNALEPVKSSSLIGRAIVPVPTVPLYVGQQPVYYYYPQAAYPNTGVVYRTPITTGVQYPYYGWSNTPSYKPSVPTAPTNTNGVNTGDPNNPKNDVEYIY